MHTQTQVANGQTGDAHLNPPADVVTEPVELSDRQIELAEEAAEKRFYVVQLGEWADEMREAMFMSDMVERLTAFTKIGAKFGAILARYDREAFAHAKGERRGW